VTNFQRSGVFLCLMCVMLTTACAPIKNLEVWKDEAHTGRMQKVLVIAVARQENIRNQFENVFSIQLAKRGIEAIPGHKVLPQGDAKPDRETVLATVRELGIDSVFVTRSINKKEIVNHQYGGAYYAATAVYDNGWHTYYSGYFYNREYDTDYFTVATNLFDVNSKKPFWSDLSQVKVDGSPQGAVNLLIPSIVKQLEESQLIDPQP